MTISTAVPVSAVARVLGIKTEFKDFRGSNTLFLPQRIAVVGQGASASVYDTTKRQVTSAAEAGSLYGFGSPIHLAVKQLLPANGDGVATIPVTIYPLEDDASGVAATGDITPGGAQTVAAAYIVRVNNIDSEEFVINAGDSVATITAAMTVAINAVLDMPVIAADNATDVGLTSKWEGVSANDIFVEVVGSTTAGTTFAITQLSGGLVNPDVQPALDQFGDIWETLLLNCLDIADTSTLDKYQTFIAGRWGSLVNKPLVAFTGNTNTTVTAATAVSDARPLDFYNSQLVAPGSKDLPFVVAARQLARIALVSNNLPGHDYGSQRATGLVPGDDGDQWTYIDRDAAVKKGSSTIEVRDGVINIADVITFYKPTGELPPAYRFVVDIIKLQNIIFNVRLRFAVPEWDGAPLLPDDAKTVRRDAKQPKAAKALIGLVLDGLEANALISDAKTAKANTLAEIDDMNPKRLNLVVPVQLSGNTNIKSIDLKFGFFFGTPTVI